MEKSTARLEAFSDGIFSVAITLLALEIGIKEYVGATDKNLWTKIIENWPEYFTYLNSFATILLIWMGHRQILERLKKVNHWVLLTNGLVLFIVVLFPFPTRLVGNFIGTNAAHTAVAFYAGFTGLITLSMVILNACILNNKQLIIDQNESVPWFRKMIQNQIAGFVLYELAAVIGLYFIFPALAITFLMWVYWIFYTRD